MTEAEGKMGEREKETVRVIKQTRAGPHRYSCVMKARGKPDQGHPFPMNK